MPAVNYFAISAAAIANWMLGAIWYGAFGKSWLQALGKRMEDMNPKDIKPYFIALVGSWVNALALALILWATDAQELTAFVGIGAIMGVGIVAMAAAKHYAFSAWPLRLFLIDLGVDVVGFVLMSLILGLWK